ncbi:MAG: ribonuclease III [Clostridiales bacterium]|nr:ribonuclease III [Clostridiales bacterium]
MFDIDNMDVIDARNLNPQVLAFVGDGVYSLYIRHKLVVGGNSRGKDLHNEVTSFVKASGQSELIARLLPMLNEDEVAVFKRARNHKTLSQAKNQKITDYRRATGLEAVLGYLYLSGKMDRITSLLNSTMGEDNES